MRRNLLSFVATFVLAYALLCAGYVAIVNNIGVGVVTCDPWLSQALQYKYAICDKIEGHKIVVIGGSESLFSTDSGLLAQQTGMPVVNLGTHIGIPLRFYPAILEGKIKPGDVVVYSLAFNGQHNCGEKKLYSDLALQMYWNGLYPDVRKSLSMFDLVKLYAKYGTSWISLSIKKDERKSLSEDVLEEYAVKHNETLLTYQFYTYNKFGDKLCPDNNIGDEKLESGKAPLLSEVTDEFEQSFRTLRNFVYDQGADLIVVLNNIVYYPHYDSETIGAFEKSLRKAGVSLSCGDYSGLCFPAEYYFDTNLHMTDKGAKFLTYEIAKAVNRSLGRRNPDVADWPVVVFSGHLDAVTKLDSHQYLVRCKKPANLKSKSCIAYCLVDRLKQGKRNVVRSLAVNGVQAEVKERVKTVRNEIVFRFKSDNSDEFVMSFDLENDVRFERIIFDEAEDLDVFDFHLGGHRIKPVEGFSPVFSRTNGCWTDGNKAIVKLQVQPRETERIRLQVTFSTPRPNTITVSAGGEQLAIWDVPGGRTVERQVNVPSKYLTEDNWLPLEFDIETTVCPAKEGISTDTRNLGMSMKMVRIVDNEEGGALK